MTEDNPPALNLPIPPFLPPKRYDPRRREIIPEVVWDLAHNGLTVEQMAPYFRMTPRALAQRFSDDPELMLAFRSGLADMQLEAGQVIGHRMRQGDLEAAKFIAARKAGWTSSRDIRIAPTAGIPPTIDGHVLDLAAKHSALLDSPDPDSVPDAEWSEVTAEPVAESAPATAGADASISESELAAMME
jgi:hypothetical protein